jgi:hypothetical protein
MSCVLFSSSFLLEGVKGELAHPAEAINGGGLHK